MRLFDSNRQVTIKILSDGGEKQCVLRFPTNDELVERSRKQKAYRKNLGRGKSQYDPGNTRDLDAELFNKIRVDKDGDAFDDAESVKAMEKLDRVEVQSVERQGGVYNLQLKVPGAVVTHVLGIPLQKDVMEYGRSSIKSIDEGRQTQIRMTIEPAMALWDKVKKEVIGYAEGSAIPVTHMDAALMAMLNQMELDMEDPDPED